MPSHPCCTWIIRARRVNGYPTSTAGAKILRRVDFLREMNIMVHEEFPGCADDGRRIHRLAGVSRPVYLGGLGFSIKWNMGWMNDTLGLFPS